LGASDQTLYNWKCLLDYTRALQTGREHFRWSASPANNVFGFRFPGGPFYTLSAAGFAGALRLGPAGRLSTDDFPAQVRIADGGVPDLNIDMVAGFGDTRAVSP